MVVAQPWLRFRSPQAAVDQAVAGAREGDLGSRPGVFIERVCRAAGVPEACGVALAQATHRCIAVWTEPAGWQPLLSWPASDLPNDGLRTGEPFRFADAVASRGMAGMTVLRAPPRGLGAMHLTPRHAT